MRSGDTARLPWASLRRQLNPQRCPIFRAKVDSRFFSSQLHKIHRTLRMSPGYGCWRHRSAMECKRSDSPRGSLRTAEGRKSSVSDLTKVIVCPLWDARDYRLRARHYNAWKSKCSRCGREVAVADSLKPRASAQELRVRCEQCDLVENSK
jgi:DNA-directed RNA polymerase subunit RPC12/RpoP